MTFLIIAIGLSFINWLIGLATEKGIFYFLATLCLTAAILFIACLVGIMPIF